MNTNDPRQWDMAEAVEALCSWAYADSHVILPEAEVRIALEADVDAGALVMTEEEAETFILGGDDGEVPEELLKRYPRLQTVVAKFWGC